MDELIQCPECPNMFIKKTRKQKCCSPECQKERIKRFKRVSNQEDYNGIYDAIDKSPRVSLIEAKHAAAREMGISYGEYVARETVEKFARIKL